MFPLLPQRLLRRPLQRHNSSAVKPLPAPLHRKHPQALRRLHRMPPPQRLLIALRNPHGASLRR